MTDEAPEVYYVQGQEIPEYLISLALEQLKYEYYFQFVPYGMIGLRGTPRIDFLVNVMPNWIPLEYDGDIWHTGQYRSSDEQFQRALVAQYFKIPEVPVITGDEVDSDTPLEEVVVVVRRKLRQ